MPVTIEHMQNSYVIQHLMDKQAQIIYIETELQRVITAYYQTPNTVSLTQWLVDEMSKLYDLSPSFDDVLYIYYYEYLDENIADALFSWIHSTLCNKKNIVLLTHTIGLEQYYKNYCAFYRISPVTLIEVAGSAAGTPSAIKLIDVNDKNTKNIEHVFSYYGGTYGSKVYDKTLTYIMLTNTNVGVVDRMFDFCERSFLENNLEKLTEYVDVNQVNSILNDYDRLLESTYKKPEHSYQHVDNDTMLLANRTHTHENELFHSQIDNKCFASAIRETGDVNCIGFSGWSEKTSRCILNKCFPIPLSGMSMDPWREWGYWVPDIIDYSYLQEVNVLKRLQVLSTELVRLSKLDLTDYYNSNFDKILHNQHNLLYNHKKKIMKRINEIT